MAITFTLTDGSTSIPLVYDAATQSEYQMHKGRQSLDSPLSPLWHTPDNQPPQLVRLTPGVRTLFFMLHIAGRAGDTTTISGEAMDATLNKIAALARPVDGPDQQAARYVIDGDANRVTLKVQLEGATNATYIPVIYGQISTFDGLFSELGEDNAQARHVPVTLYVEPYGEGDVITLRNDLTGSPGMTEFVSGLALGLGLVGSPTVLQAPTHWLVGGSSQRFDAPATGSHGIVTAAVTAVQGSQAVAYAWVAAQPEEDILTIRLNDGANTAITSKLFNPADPSDYDQTAVDRAGLTWYRYVVSGVNSGAANFRLRIDRNTSHATKASIYVIDAIYLQTGTTTAPAAWMSGAAIQNNSQEFVAVNHIDTWGIPGDVPALVKLTFAPSSLAVSGNPMQFVAAKARDGKVLAAQHKYRYEGESWSSQTAGLGSWSVGSTSGISYARFTGSGTGGFGVINFNLTGQALINFARMTWRVFARVRASATTITFRISLIANSTVVVIGETKRVITANTFSLLDLGLINARGVWADLASGAAVTENAQLAVTVQSVNSGQTADVDGFWLLPVQHGGDFLIGLIGSTAGLWTTAKSLVIDGASREMYLSTSGKKIDYLGELRSVAPGNNMTRMMFLIRRDSDSTHFVTDAMKATLQITPRTRHLLGTV